MIASLKNLGRYRHLLVQMTIREFTDRYAGQAVGAAWAWAHPVLLMLLYATVFNHLFSVRFGQGIDLPRDYTSFLLAGLVPWLAMQDVLGRGSDAVLSHASYVKQTAFPLEVLPVKRALSSLPILLVGTLFILLYQVLMFGSLPWTVLLWPVFLLFFLAFSIGITFLFGSLGVYFRDLREVVSVFLAANLFLLPILFLPGQAPSLLRFLFWINPFSYLVWIHQDLLFYGRIEHPEAWVVFPLLSLGVLALGFGMFQRLRPYFGEAI